MLIKIIKIIGTLVLLLMLGLVGILAAGLTRDIRSGRKPHDSSAVADKRLKRGSALLGVVLGLWAGK